ncbi:MAG: hypothetical protein ACF8LK_00480 [Phycisphaerales bacterium JB041]
MKLATRRSVGSHTNIVPETLEPRIVLDGEWSAMDGAVVHGSTDGTYLTVTTLDLNNDPIVFEQTDRADDGENDLWSRIGLLTTEDGRSDDVTFGAPGRSSIAIHGDRLILGAPGANDGEGAAAVFRYRDDSATWRFETLLTIPGLDGDEGFGWAVSMHGNTAVIGSRAGNAAWVFRDRGSWELQATLGGTVDQDGAFGSAVATDGSVIVIGAPMEETVDDDTEATSGAVYIFERRGNDWELNTRISAPDNARDGEFGHSVAVHSNSVIVGAWLDDDRGEASGSVFAVGKDGRSWSIEAKLTLAGDAAGARFGADVAASGSRAAVISLGSDDADLPAVAQILKRRGDRWSVEATLEADGLQNPDWRSVAYHGDRVILGTGGEDSAAMIFRKGDDTDRWSQETTLQATADSETAHVGFDVAVHGETFVVAGMLADGLNDDEAVDAQAAAWVYRAPDDDDGGSDVRRVWVVRSLGDLPGVDDPVSDVLTWTDTKDGQTYAAVATTDGLVLLTRSADRSTWTARNLTNEIPGAEEIVGDISVLGTRGGRVYIVGYASDGDMVIYRQNGLGVPGAYAWVFENITEDELTPKGFSTPRFAGTITTFVTRWNALNITGLDSDGNVRAVWMAPGSNGWRSSDLSAIAGTPELEGTLSVFLTPWGAMNLAGTSTSGNLVVTWWTPGIGQWVVSDFNNLFGGPQLEQSTLTAFATPWGALNVAGRDSRGDLVVYWWTPDFRDSGDDRWRVTNLSSFIDGSDQPVGAIRGLVAQNGEISLFGTNAINDVIRYYWEPGERWQMENLTHTAQPL